MFGNVGSVGMVGKFGTEAGTVDMGTVVIGTVVMGDWLGMLVTGDTTDVAAGLSPLEAVCKEASHEFHET